MIADKNILMRDEIRHVSTDGWNLRKYVTLHNGREVKAKMNSKGAYILVDGKRKYILQGYTYGKPLP